MLSHCHNFRIFIVAGSYICTTQGNLNLYSGLCDLLVLWSIWSWIYLLHTCWLFFMNQVYSYIVLL
ncbi:hypothetical protein BDV34DRAFT_188528 [Aspergillus parasiticus]|uniref:Uncharacterized protein n=1 Tax=Aspergillus parasiticus TaxID=5067 RepID=A0A5N6DXA6_ASPPA|nr:hypothetical protein BDV34DRAFT_188528 [Aspergillus parasiticus]